MNNIRTPGRNITVGEACAKLNPHLFKSLDPDVKKILNSYPVDTPKKKRIRQSSKPLMNKLEQEYYDLFLKQSTDFIAVQSIRFRLANGIWYKPDFYREGLFRMCVEVKGPHAFRGGFENLKVAAHQYPWIRWILVWKEDGHWQSQTILP